METIIFKLFLGLISVIACLHVAESAKVRGCYYTNWAQYRPDKGKYVPENYQSGLCTHILYAFCAMNSDFTIKTVESNDEAMYAKVIGLKKSQSDLKVLLSFGGATFSQQNAQLLSTMLSSSQNRQKFINSVIAFVRKYNFDGFDVDYEFPAAKDKANFATLLNELKAAFDNETKNSKKTRLILSAAVSSGIQQIDTSYDIPALGKAVDYIFVMTYDFHGSWEKVTGFNSPLNDRNNDKLAVSNAMNYWAQKGAPKDKLIVGLAAYGHGWTLSNPSNSNVGAPASGPSNALPYSKVAGTAFYYETCTLLEKGAKRTQDEQQKVPYLVSGNQWVGYDDVWSFNAKLDWLKQNNFGGAFTWSLDQDDFQGQCKSSNGKKYPLHNAIVSSLGKS